ncbi:MAG TPA: SAF domain-containing protein, partial [Terriglobales bacterium]|nr:SAF domain-containing protein [Terriglobales bacterium]
IKGPDSAFSLEPAEFEEMVRAVRVTEESLGAVRYGASASEEKSVAFRRSLYVVEEVKKGNPFTSGNVRSIRPSQGLHTRYFQEILTKRAARDIERGTPLSWDLVAP